MRKFKKTSVTGLSAQALQSKTYITLKMFKCKIKCISIGFEGKKPLKLNLISPNWSMSTICHLLKTVKIPPSLINTLGVQKIERPELHRERHKHTRVQMLCWHVLHMQPWQGWSDEPGEADTVTEGPPTAHSPHVCFAEKGDTAFRVSLTLVRHFQY